MMSPKRPVSTPTTADYSTQGNADQMAPQENHKYNQNNLTTAMPSNDNYFIPDGSARRIHDIQDKMDIMPI